MSRVENVKQLEFINPISSVFPTRLSASHLAKWSVSRREIEMPQDLGYHKADFQVRHGFSSTGTRAYEEWYEGLVHPASSRLAV
ncbi:hypothetical protein DL766_003248 [Monosporascus sp. MC13-8B]|nr:hypothetical protein DL766_003248 [Monosporascus sp. MC13-8B]